MYAYVWTPTSTTARLVSLPLPPSLYLRMPDRGVLPRLYAASSSSSARIRRALFELSFRLGSTSVFNGRR